MKLSIIMPVYNVEDYLCKCIDSVLNQDYEDYEVILVDDGSPDECPKICDSYAKKHDNIRVVHRENGGLSAARNSGIEVAIGEYILFVDSDDYIEPNVLGTLMEQVEREQLDVLRFDYQNVRLKNEGVRKLESEGDYEVFEPNKAPRYMDKKSEVVNGETYLNTRMGYACYAWQFIICKDIVNTFYEGIHFEDTEWLPRMMLAAKRVNSTTTVVYNYLVRQGSITKVQGDKIKIRKNLEDRLTIVGQYKKYIEQYPDCQWLRNMRSRMVAGILTDVALNFYSQRNEYIERMREFNVFPLTIANQGKTYSRRARMINLFGPRIYCALMHMRK